MAVQEWKKLGFSDEEAEELHKMVDRYCCDYLLDYINFDEATDALIKCMEEFNANLSEERKQEIIDKFNEIPEQYIIPNTYHGWEVKLEKNNEENN